MTTPNHPHKHRTPDSHPRVKIYYLKNDPISNQPERQSRHYVSPIAGPSVSCLSSFIQKERNKGVGQVGEGEVGWWGGERGDGYRVEGMGLSEPVKQRARHGDDDHNNNNNNTQPLMVIANHTTTLKPSTSPIDDHPTGYSYPRPKRFSKTSHQPQFHSHYLHQNNEALSKDFLCNIVKQWTAFQQKERMCSTNNKKRRSLLGARRFSHQSEKKHEKVYKGEEVGEVRRNNRELMRGHFQLFLENQKGRGNEKKQDQSLTLLKAIFHREGSDGAIGRGDNRNDNNSNSLQAPSIGFSTHKQSNSTAHRARTTSSSKDHSSQRRFSTNQPTTNPQYFRLLYGPEVKLIPRLFEEKGRIQNFDWTKLDKKLYEGRRRGREESGDK